MAAAHNGKTDGTRIDIRLKPRAKNDRIAVTATGAIEIAVTSPPIDDRANDHLVALLADRLGMPKSALAIVGGRHGRNKIVAVPGLMKETILEKLAAREGRQGCTRPGKG
jgi:uncharacterized protein (TIGR00251 family)